MITLSFAIDIAEFFQEILAQLELFGNYLSNTVGAIVKIIPITANIIGLKNYIYAALPAAVILVIDLCIVLAVVNVVFRGFGGNG